MSGEYLGFLIGSRDSDFLRVRPIARAHPDASDYWDGNWLNTDIELSAGAFRAQYVACLRVDELTRFRDQLTELYNTLDGQAVFDSMEPWLSISVKGDGLGHFNVDCVAMDNVGVGNKLDFSLCIDQTQIPGILVGLNQALEQFSLIGNRDV
ncbi:MAG: hypothetical protein M5U26_05490 [Planctomycetota bacterium]|nr:hypothetical protein [Planctomycetota bacterium]